MAGHEDVNAPIRPDELLWVPSITRTMTGAVILQLAEEHRL